MSTKNSKTKQFREQLPTATIAALDRLAKQYGKRSGSTVAAEIIIAYMAAWERTQKMMREQAQMEPVCSQS